MPATTAADHTAERCDLLVVAAAVLTPDAIAGGSPAGFVAVRDGAIAAVGPGSEAQAWAAGADRVIDLGAATVTPGLIDAHIHPVLGMTLARGLDLSGLRHREEVRRALAAEVAANPGQDWILAWGLDPAVFGDGAFDNSLFGGVADGRLVFVTLFDGHAALVSDTALAAAGVTGAETFPDSARVGVDAAGRPTGMLFELSAQELVRAILPEPGFDERVGQLGDLLGRMAGVGLVGGQVLDFGAPDMFELLEELERRAELSLRLRISPWVMPGATKEDLERLAAMQGRSGRRWHVRGIKLMIDGTVDNGTAWLFEPDSHGESTSSLWLDPEEFARVLAFFHERGIPTATHAIGDRGISFVARTIAAQRPNGTVHRIEHIETLPDAVLQEIVDAGAATSMQPTHCTLYTRADQRDNWSLRLGRERADRAWRTRDLRDRGAIVALGSDWPIAPFDPRGIIASAQTRRPPGRRDTDPVLPAQSLSATAALEGYTSEYWRSVGEEGGAIVPGARADLTAFADNPLTTPPDAFAASAVLLTVVDGEVVVERSR